MAKGQIITRTQKDYDKAMAKYMSSEDFEIKLEGLKKAMAVAEVKKKIKAKEDKKLEWEDKQQIKLF